MADDYGSMQTRIADELARSDLTSQIQLSIQSAIRHYERHPFYFNEATGTFSTVANQEYYSSSDFSDMPNINEIHSVEINVNGKYPLIPTPWTMMDRISTDPTLTGEPVRYTYYKQQMRLYPVPSAIRTITVAYIKRLTTLSGSADTNAWMTDGEMLIRYHAKWDLFTNLVRDFDEADRMSQAEAQALQSLMAATTRRLSTGRVRATAF